MLQKLHALSKTWVSGLFLGLLSLAFVSWGVGDILQGGVSTAVATIGDRTVEQEEFQRDYNNYLKSVGRERGTAITTETARREGMADIVLRQSIITTALDNVVNDLGLTIGEEAVTRQIRAMPQFAGYSGQFDKATFLRMISEFGYGENGFIRAMRTDIARTQLTQAVEAGFVMPAGYAKGLLAYYAEQRAAEYVVVNEADLPPVAPPDDATLGAFVKARPGQFSTPEYRDITFAAITPRDLIGSVTVTDALLRQAYETAKSKYVTEEKRTVDRLTLSTEQEAKDALAKIKAGAKFADIAKAAGFGPAETGLGEVVAKDLGDAAAKPVFALKEGETSQPIKSDFGWDLFHVSKIAPQTTTPFEQAKAELTPLVAQQLARAKLDEIANAYSDAYDTKGLSMTEAAMQAGMKVSRIKAIDAQGLGPDGAKPAAAPDDEEFRKRVFSAEIGEENNPVQSKTGAFYVIQVHGQIPPKLKPLAAVRDRAIEAWTALKRAELAKKRAADLAADANQRKSLKPAAEAIRAKLETSKALTRREPGDVFSQSALDAVFEAMPGETVFAPLAKGKGYVVARITGIAHRLPSEKNPLYVNAVKQLSKNVGEDVVTSFAVAARDAQGVKINRKLLDSAVGGGEGQ